MPTIVIELYFLIRLVFLGLLFIIAIAGDITGNGAASALFERVFGQKPIDKIPFAREFHRKLAWTSLWFVATCVLSYSLIPERIMRQALCAVIGKCSEATTSPPPSPCVIQSGLKNASAQGIEELKKFISKCESTPGALIYDAQRNLDRIAYRKAVVCIKDSRSCDFDVCLRQYERDGSFNEFLSILEAQAQSAKESLKCKPKQPESYCTAQSALFDAENAGLEALKKLLKGCGGIEGFPRREALERLERVAKSAALDCINATETCNFVNCINLYQDNSPSWKYLEDVRRKIAIASDRCQNRVSNNNDKPAGGKAPEVNNSNSKNYATANECKYTDIDSFSILCNTNFGGNTVVRPPNYQQGSIERCAAACRRRDDCVAFNMSEQPNSSCFLYRSVNKSTVRDHSNMVSGFKRGGGGG